MGGVSLPSCPTFRNPNAPPQLDDNEGAPRPVPAHFGFTLHDQNARTHAGHGGLQSAIALLPPAYDEAKSYNQVRARARLVAATLARIFAYAIPGRIAKYDDTYNPGAFGDLMQEWGTGTVLIESGARLPALQRRRRKRPPHPRRAPGDPRSLRPKQ
jgi:hypothetical protein